MHPGKLGTSTVNPPVSSGMRITWRVVVVTPWTDACMFVIPLQNRTLSIAYARNRMIVRYFVCHPLRSISAIGCGATTAGGSELKALAPQLPVRLVHTRRRGTPVRDPQVQPALSSRCYAAHTV